MLGALPLGSGALGESALVEQIAYSPMVRGRFALGGDALGVHALGGSDHLAAILSRSSRYGAVGVGSSALRADVRYVTTGATLQSLFLKARYATEAERFELLSAARRYAAAAPDSQFLGLDRRYATFAGAAGLRFDRNYETFGASSFGLSSGRVYATEAAPYQLLVRDARYAIEGVIYAPEFGLSQQFSTEAPQAVLCGFDHRFAVEIPAAYALPFDHRYGFTMILKRAVTIVYGSKIRRAIDIRCDLGLDVIKRGVVLDAAMLSPVKRAVILDAAMKETDTVRREVVLSASMTDGATIIAASPPTVTVRGRSFKAESVDVSFDAGQYAWTCQLTLADPAHYLLFGVDEPFTVTLGTEDYSFIRQEPRFAVSSQVNITATISGISPSAVYAEPRAQKITKTWEAETAGNVLDELLTDVELRVLDWTIPAGRLASQGQTPMDIAQSIARATGGFIETDPDGSIYLRYQWPVSVPALDAASPDIEVEDARSTFNADESVANTRIINKLRIMDVASDVNDYLAAEIDSREDGYNSGRTRFIPGDQPAFLIFKGERVRIDRVRSSAGHIAGLPSGNMTVEEILTFAETNEAQLRYPTAALDSYTWLGTNLGVPTVDGRTVRVPTVGVGVLKVEYETAFVAAKIAGVPAVLNGETEYDVLALVEGSS